MIVDVSKLFLIDYAVLYFKEHTFGTSKDLAIGFDSIERNENPSIRRVCQFGQALRHLREKGFIIKYSGQLYKKVKKIGDKN